VTKINLYGHELLGVYNIVGGQRLVQELSQQHLFSLDQWQLLHWNSLLDT